MALTSFHYLEDFFLHHHLKFPNPSPTKKNTHTQPSIFGASKLPPPQNGNQKQPPNNGWQLPKETHGSKLPRPMSGVPWPHRNVTGFSRSVKRWRHCPAGEVTFTFPNALRHGRIEMGSFMTTTTTTTPVFFVFLLLFYTVKQKNPDMFFYCLCFFVKQNTRNQENKIVACQNKDSYYVIYIDKYTHVYFNIRTYIT